MPQYKVEFCYFMLYFPEKEGGPSKSNELQNDLVENTKNNGSSHATESLTTFLRILQLYSLTQDSICYQTRVSSRQVRAKCLSLQFALWNFRVRCHDYYFQNGSYSISNASSPLRKDIMFVCVVIFL